MFAIFYFYIKHNLLILMKNITDKINESKPRTKKVKVYRIIAHYSPMWGNSREYKFEGTLEELIEAFSYTLEVGESWQHERGNKKINRNPKTIQSLCTNLENAKNNAARNGYGGYYYTYEEIGTVEIDPNNERDMNENYINESRNKKRN